MAKPKMKWKKQLTSYQFGTAEQVETYSSLAEKFLNTQGKLQFLGKQFFDRRIVELKSLKIALLNSEKNFYNSLNLKGTSRQCLDELQQKIQIWNTTGASNLINDSTGELFLRLIGMFQSVNIEELGEIYANELIQQEVFGEIFVVDREDEIENLISRFIEKVFKEKGNMQIKQSVFRSYIKIIKTDDNKFKLILDKKISNNYARKLAQIFNETVQEERIKIKKADYNRMKYNICEEILNTAKISEPARIYIKSEIIRRFDKYGYAQNVNVIKGFLGEIYWNAFFSYLLGRPGSTIPTGIIKDQKGKSITIDMVVEGFGFQIKNYKIDENGETVFHGGMSAANLIVERAQITPSEALLYLFGSWAYNQPITGASEEYEDTYNEMNNLVEQSSAIFQLYADRIIGLDKTFSAQKNNFGLYENQALYYNSFFLINTKIVPGSSIIQAIINSMEETMPNIRFEAEYSKPTENLWPNPPPSSAYEAAKKARVDYEVYLNVDNIIKKAYNMADDI